MAGMGEVRPPVEVPPHGEVRVAERGTS
jgi:hypothetical protein